MNNIDKNIFNSYETVETAFNNDLRAFYPNGRTMKARALKGTSYHFKSDKARKRYDVSAEECRIYNLFCNTWNDLNKAQSADNMMVYYKGNVWWFERATLRVKVREMVNAYIDAFEAWLDEKNEDEVTEEATEEVKNSEETEEAKNSEETVTVEEPDNKESSPAVVEYKLIEGFENYMVSSDGKVFSIDYLHTGKMQELKPQTDKGGYLRVCLCANGRCVMKSVHRLVAEAFIDNPDNKPQVNHIDEDKANNRAENLQWCTADYNNNFGTRNERAAKARINHKDLSTPVLCLETGVVYPSVREAERQTGIHRPSISKCLNGKRKTAGGFHWARFVEGDNPIYE